MRAKVFLASLAVSAAALAFLTVVIASDRVAPANTASEELRSVAQEAVLAFALTIPFALALAWLASALLSKRVRAIAAVAQRYKTGDLTRPSYDYGPDEL